MILTKIFFNILFTFRFVYKYCKTEQLELENLSEQDPENKCDIFVKKMNHLWVEEGYMKYEQNALIRAIIRMNLQSVLMIFFLSLVSLTMDILNTFLFREFLVFYGKTTDEGQPAHLINSPAVLGIVFIVSKMVSLFIQRHLIFYQETLGIKTSTLLSSFVYVKIQTISPSLNKKVFTEGEITNFVLVDSKKTSDCMQNLNSLFTVPIMLLAYYVYLLCIIGPSFLLGIIASVSLIILGYRIHHTYREDGRQLLKQKDDRVILTNEILSSLKVIKLYGWDDQFLDKVFTLRKKEIRTLKKIYDTGSISISFNSFFPYCCCKLPNFIW